jgi:hypothetical protein
MALEDLFTGNQAVDNPDEGKATAVDQIQNSNGSVTTYWSDGSSSTKQPIQGAQNVQTNSPDFATQIKNLFSGNSSLGTAGQIGSIAGLLGLLSNMGGSSNTYAGYKGGIPSLTGVRQQYATPQMQIGQYAPNLPTNATAAQKAGALTQDQLSSYLKSGNVSDQQIASQMNRYGITPANLSGITGIDQAAVQQRYNQIMGPNTQLGTYRPGQGGITYFSPMKYMNAPAAPVEPTVPVTVAHGGLLNSYNTGGIASLGAYSDGGQLLRGPGDGVSDSIPAVIGEKQPARLADGEFVVPARIVSELGNGSTESGARKLYGMMDRVKRSRAKAKNIAADTKSDKYLPA